MKSLKESLFEYDNTQTMESLFDKDLIQKEVKVISLLDLIKGKVKNVNLNSGIPLFKFFPGDFIMRMKKDYDENILPTKRFKSKYDKQYGILNPFINYILDNTYLDDSNYKYNNIDSEELNKDLNDKSKIPIKVSFYRHVLNDKIIAIVIYISGGNIIITARLELEGLSIKDYYRLFGEIKESLFDKDLVQKEIPGHRLKDLVFFDGQWVYRLLSWKGFGFKNPHALEIIDWKKVRQDLKKFDGNKIDLGLYAYASADQHNIRNADTNKKTENFARLILSIPFNEECNFFGFNSRFRDEFLEKLDNYILPNWKRDFHFELITTRFGLVFTLHYSPWGDQELLRFEFLKKDND